MLLQIVRKLTACMTQFNPFASIYKTMGDLLKAEEDSGGQPEMLRVRVVSPADYANSQLQVKNFFVMRY